MVNIKKMGLYNAIEHLYSKKNVTKKDRNAIISMAQKVAGDIDVGFESCFIIIDPKSKVAGSMINQVIPFISKFTATTLDDLLINIDDNINIREHLIENLSHNPEVIILVSSNDTESIVRSAVIKCKKTIKHKYRTKIIKIDPENITSEAILISVIFKLA